MTTIAAAPAMPNAMLPIPVDPGADPNELVGKGETQARWLGGLAGFGAGVGVATGISALTSRTNVTPLKVIGGIASAAAIGGGAFGGQYLLGQATRSTRAEADRALRAEQQDLGIQARVLQAKAGGALSSKDEQHVTELRRERQSLVKSEREPNFVGKYVVPAVATAAVGAAAAVIAYKVSPDDGKGITALFNGMMAGGFGAAGGLWAGTTLGDILTRSEPTATIPADAQARIDAIDTELDELLGVHTLPA